jgi:hypothetical protein
MVSVEAPSLRHASWDKWQTYFVGYCENKPDPVRRVQLRGLRMLDVSQTREARPQGGYDWSLPRRRFEFFFYPKTG